MNFDFKPSEYEGANVRYLVTITEAERRVYAEKIFSTLVRCGSDDGIAFFMAALIFVHSKYDHET